MYLEEMHIHKYYCQSGSGLSISNMTQVWYINVYHIMMYMYLSACQYKRRVVLILYDKRLIIRSNSLVVHLLLKLVGFSSYD